MSFDIPMDATGNIAGTYKSVAKADMLGDGEAPSNPSTSRIPSQGRCEGLSRDGREGWDGREGGRAGGWLGHRLLLVGGT